MEGAHLPGDEWLSPANPSGSLGGPRRPIGVQRHPDVPGGQLSPIEVVNGHQSFHFLIHGF